MVTQKERYRVRFNRWHDKQIDLTTFCINLIFTIAIAIAGFVIEYSSNNAFKEK